MAKYSLAALEDVQANSLTTFVKIKRKIEDLGATVTTPKSMVECKYSDSNTNSPLQDMANEVIAQSEAIVWVIKSYEQILLAKQRIRDKRLVNELGFEKGRRVGDDLDRFFFRALALPMINFHQVAIPWDKPSIDHLAITGSENRATSLRWNIKSFMLLMLSTERAGAQTKGTGDDELLIERFCAYGYGIVSRVVGRYYLCATCAREKQEGYYKQLDLKRIF